MWLATAAYAEHQVETGPGYFPSLNGGFMGGVDVAEN